MTWTDIESRLRNAIKTWPRDKVLVRWCKAELKRRATPQAGR